MKKNKKGYFKPQKIKIYKDFKDKELKIPPLFIVRYEFSDIDWERIKIINEINVDYELISQKER